MRRRGLPDTTIVLTIFWVSECVPKGYRDRRRFWCEHRALAAGILPPHGKVARLTASLCNEEQWAPAKGPTLGEEGCGLARRQIA